MHPGTMISLLAGARPGAGTNNELNKSRDINGGGELFSYAFAKTFFLGCTIDKRSPAR